MADDLAHRLDRDLAAQDPDDDPFLGRALEGAPDGDGVVGGDAGALGVPARGGVDHLPYHDAPGVADKVVQQPRNRRDRPLENIVMESVTIEPGTN